MITGWLDSVIGLLGRDPFFYLVATIFCIFVWVWCTMVSSLALSGRALWIRRGSLVMAVVAAVLFAYSANHLH